MEWSPKKLWALGGSHASPPLRTGPGSISQLHSSIQLGLLFPPFFPLSAPNLLSVWLLQHFLFMKLDVCVIPIHVPIPWIRSASLFASTVVQKWFFSIIHKRVVHICIKKKIVWYPDGHPAASLTRFSTKAYSRGTKLTRCFAPACRPKLRLIHLASICLWKVGLSLVCQKKGLRAP
jgi:hypothetical protein